MKNTHADVHLKTINLYLSGPSVLFYQNIITKQACIAKISLYRNMYFLPISVHLLIRLFWLALRTTSTSSVTKLLLPSFFHHRSAIILNLINFCLNFLIS